MADWFLILTIVVTFLILLVVATYVLVYYQHPDDKNDAWFPKLTVVLGIVVSIATVLLLPLDVANNEGYSGCDGYDSVAFCGGLNMVLFWNIIYYLIPVFLFLLIPFMTFFYEADDGLLMAGTSVGGQANSRVAEALKYQAGVIVILGIIFGVMFHQLAESDIPVAEYTGGVDGVVVALANPPTSTFSTASLGETYSADVDYYTRADATVRDQIIRVAVPLPTFFASALSFFGWFVFAVFGGIGITALPLELILAFVHRPRHMDAVEFAEAQVNIRERVNELVDLGELMKIAQEERNLASQTNGTFNPFKGFSKDAREERSTLLEFKKAVYLLEKDVDDFNKCSKHYSTYNPLIPWFALAGGIFSIILSLVWIIQIAINVLPNEPLHPFLNGYLQWFETWFPLIGVLSVAILSLYLLLCALKGCFRFGLRFPFFTLHPMEPGKTYMSSFMFNIGLLMLCALPVVQFTTMAFQDYARYTTVGQIFGIQVQYMKFFHWFWDTQIFVYVFVCVAGLAGVYLICCKKEDRSKSSIYLRDRLRNRN